MKYYISVDGRELEVSVHGSDILADGIEQEAHLVAIPGTPLRHLRLGDRSWVLAIEAGPKGEWALGLHGNRWDLEVVDERTRYIRTLTSAAVTRSGPGITRAPMPGLVVRVEVVVGQLVAEGAGVVVLEAMKMENELRTGAVGVVRAVHVTPGQVVEQGQVLVEFDPSP